MSDFQSYMLQQEKVNTARAEYNHSICKLDNAQIHMRLAEIKSQHEPLNSLGGDRDMLYAAAHYVVTGRLP